MESIARQKQHEEILRLLSDSISKRTGKEVVLSDIMQYQQYRRPMSDYKPEDIIGAIRYTVL
jgi:hypothetical protein